MTATVHESTRNGVDTSTLFATLDAVKAAPEAATHLKGTEICIDVDLDAGGDESATVWTCDLSAEYVRINGEYRT